MAVGVIKGNVASMNVVQATWDIPSVAAATTAEKTFTLQGARTTDFVLVEKLSLDAGIGFCSARISAADTVSVTIVNATASAVDAASQTVRVLLIRPEAIGTGLDV